MVALVHSLNSASMELHVGYCYWLVDYNQVVRIKERLQTCQNWVVVCLKSSKVVIITTNVNLYI